MIALDPGGGHEAVVSIPSFRCASTSCPTGGCSSWTPRGGDCCAGSRAGLWAHTPTFPGSRTSLEDIVADERGNAYINSIGFDFPGGQFAPA